MSAMQIEFGADLDAATRGRVVDALAGFADFTTPVRAVRRLTGGGSNENFVLTTDAGDLVLRLAGTLTERLALDRARGLEAHRRAVAAGSAPELLACSLPTGHCITPFLPGQVLDEDLLSRPDVVENCVVALSRIHHGEPIEGAFSVFDDNRHFLALARAESQPLPDDIDALVSALDAIESVFENPAIPRLLCHNDLQVANYIVDTDRAWIIDWEYGGMADPYLDLAMLIHYGGLDRAGTDLALTTYFGTARATDRARAGLMYAVAAFREAVWSVIAAPYLSEATGFDYGAWGVRFFAETRAVVSAAGFAEQVAVAGPAADDGAAFAAARTLALASSPRRDP